MKTIEDNRSNKQYLYKPKDLFTSVRDEIHMQKTLGTDQNFMTSRLTKNATRVAAALALLGQQTSHSFAIALFRSL